MAILPRAMWVRETGYGVPPSFLLDMLTALALKRFDRILRLFTATGHLGSCPSSYGLQVDNKLRRDR